MKKEKNKEMKNILLKISSIAIVLLFLVGMNSCVKDEFDTPPVQDFPVGDVVSVSDIVALSLTVEVSDAIRITEDKSMFGLVTMSEKDGNFYKQVAFEDVTGGIMLEFLSSTSLNVGDSIQVNLNGARVYNYNKLPQIDSLEVTYNIKKISAGNKFIPQEVSVADLITNINSYTGRVVKVNNVQFTNAELGNNFAETQVTTNRDIEDCTDASIIVRTSGYSTFASKIVPNGNGSLIGFVSRFGDLVQIAIREYAEVDMEGDRCDDEPVGGGPVDPVDEINETFEGAVDYADIAITGWTLLNVQGDRNWQGKTYNSGAEKYVQATGYNSGLAAMETWLITPPVTNIGTKKLSLKTAKSFWTHTSGNPMTVLVSEDFDGENFETANWTEISPVIAGEADADNTWIESGDYDLSAFSGNAAIAFKYLGSGTESTSYRLDDIVVSTEGSGGSGGGGGGTAIYSEDFATDLGTYTGFSVLGDQVWEFATFGGGCALMSGYDVSSFENEDWMISPAYDLSDNTSTVLNVNQAAGYVNDDWSQIAILISTDYSGSGDPSSSTWTEVTAPNMPTGSDFIFVDSGDIDLSSWDGETIYVAFKYVSSASSSCTWEIGSVEIK